VCLMHCRIGEGCVGEEDCPNTLCLENICQPPRCNDFIWNGDETDIDCGGLICGATCKKDEFCFNTTDCMVPYQCKEWKCK
jgi:hypothetical protein